MKKAIVIICLTAVIFGIVLTLEWMGLLYVHGETTLTYGFQEIFDLAELDPVRVRDYLQREGSYNVIHKIGNPQAEDSVCWFSMPEWPDYWVYEVWLDEEYGPEEPEYSMEWSFSFLPSRFADEREDSVFFSRAHRPGVRGDIHISVPGGRVYMWVYGGNIRECKDIAETRLLEFYREMLRSNIG